MTSQQIVDRETEGITERVRSSLDQIAGSSVFLTGITGLIGSQLFRVIVNYNRSIEKSSAIQVGVHCRSLASFQRTCPEFSRMMVRETRSNRSEIVGIEIYRNGKVWEGDFEAALNSALGKSGHGHYDYVAHFASPTNSRFFLEYPRETREIIETQAEQILEFSKKSRAVRSILFSSNEVYGRVNSESAVSENELGELDETLPRSSYALAKRNLERMVESSRAAKAAVLRLGVCTGVGAKLDDERIYTKMASLAASGHDIELATNGESKLTMISVGDTIAGILTAWLKAQTGEIYNLANPGNFYSVAEIANLIKDSFAPEILVTLNQGDGIKHFAPERKILQDCSKMMALGWHPSEITLEIYRKLFNYFSSFYGINRIDNSAKST
jgi:nucleoside-diphosphate-sugar epimerase